MDLPINYDESSSYARKKAREEYIARQKGRCYHCNGKLDEKPLKIMREFKINKSIFPEHMFMHPVHLHHDHKTGMTLGAVHCYCNAVLWQYHGE